MDAGASIIGFVGFGLASIKTFYEFVSSIRDGPEKARDLSQALASLQGAYEKTKSLNDLPGVSCASPSLASLLERCNEDVAKFEKKIGKLRIQPQDKFHGVLWKKLKMALGEDDIAYALDIISGYVNDITLEIGLIDVRFSHQNSTGIAQVIAEGEKQSITMSRISEGVFQSVTKIQQVHEVVDALAAKAASISSMSLGQSAGIIERLAKLEDEMAKMRLQESVAQLQPSSARALEEAHGPAVRAEEAHHQGDKSDGDGYHDNAALSVKRLCALLDRKDRHAESEEAQDILDNLDTLLQDLRSPNVELIHHGAVGESSEVDNKAVLRDLRQFRGILNSSVEVSLNHELPGKANHRLQ
ncbi:hypothetical protein CSOJ01_07840 [Colletotrichum sojae]|uniref:Azaphilone pigments biosynthesis cluster protein L N-terminal domain-containing protein n=1 Tax=Colletotrichum sojae TaxID=2175907 RepID=A0A8H6J8I7_9PEZI|nr:hypothetical protein CSOJ01_07840 [Colletotrichum sojae]